MTQEELAERAQIGARTVSDLERGIALRPHVHTAQRLADALGLSENDLRRFLDARFTAREVVEVTRDLTPAGRPALHIVSPLAGSRTAGGLSGNGTSGGTEARAANPRGSTARSAIRAAGSLTHRLGIARRIVANRKTVVAVAALVALALALTFSTAFSPFGTGTMLVGPLDPRWPLPGTVPGTLSHPSAVSVDAAGNAYVMDTGNDRVDRFSPGGRFLGSFGSTGTDRGQLRQPGGIVVDGSGHVYVSDTGNDRIQEFSYGGKWLASWGSQGSHFGQLRTPRGLAIDSAGNLYVADRDNNRIQEFSRSGVFMHAWGPGIPTGPDLHPPPALYRPVAVALDQADNIYVVDGGTDHLHEFSPYAVPLGDWGRTDPGHGRLSNPTALAIQTDGTVVVGQGSGTPLIDYAALNHVRLRRQPRSMGFHVAGITLETDGALLVADAGAARILKLDRTGNVIAQFGRPPIGPGGLSAPGSIAVDLKGDLYVADTGHRRVLRLDPDGRPVTQFRGGALGFPRSVAVAPRTGDLYVLDSAAGRVQRFSATGKRLGSWGDFGDPRGIAVDTAGNVYVTDDTFGTIRKFTASGTPIATQTIAPPDITNGIGAIAVGRQGTTYVAVPSDGAVLQFSPAGQLRARWTNFHGAIAVSVDRLDNVYVADAGRFQEFSPSGRVLRTVRLPQPARVGLYPAAGIAVDARFNVFVSDGSSNRILKFSSDTSG